MIVIPDNPCLNAEDWAAIVSNHLKVFSKCLRALGMYNVSPKAPLKADADHAVLKTAAYFSHIVGWTNLNNYSLRNEEGLF